jgi:hypothetical protein
LRKKTKNKIDSKSNQPNNKTKLGSLPKLQQISGISSGSGVLTDASVGPASVMVGNLVQGNRLAAAQGRDIGLADDNERKVNFFFFFDPFNRFSLPSLLLFFYSTN